MTMKVPTEIETHGEFAHHMRREDPMRVGGLTWDTYIGDSGAVYERARETGRIIFCIGRDGEEGGA